MGRKANREEENWVGLEGFANHAVVRVDPRIQCWLEVKFVKFCGDGSHYFCFLSFWRFLYYIIEDVKKYSLFFLFLSNSCISVNFIPYSKCN